MGDRVQTLEVELTQLKHSHNELQAKYEEKRLSLMGEQTKTQVFIDSMRDMVDGAIKRDNDHFELETLSGMMCNEMVHLREMINEEREKRQKLVQENAQAMEEWSQKRQQLQEDNE